MKKTFFNSLIHNYADMAGKPASMAHLHSQRYNAFSELATQALVQISPAAIVPGKTAQFLNSAYTLFDSSLSVKEKTIHTMLALLSASQVGLSLFMIMNGQSECADISSVVCRFMLATNLLYNGVLLTDWVPGEYQAMRQAKADMRT